MANEQNQDYVAGMHTRVLPQSKMRSVWLQIACCLRELQQVWNKDAFLRSGGTAKTSKRRGENFNELYAACHAAEDKLKGLTLKHGKAVKGPLKNGAQQENIAPTDKRRDALRCILSLLDLTEVKVQNNNYMCIY